MKKIPVLFILLAVVLFDHCSSKKSNEEAMIQKTTQFNQFMDSVYQVALERDPERMTRLGIKKRYSEWTDLSEVNWKKEVKLIEGQSVELLNRVRLTELTPSAQISYKLFFNDVKACAYANEIPNTAYSYNRFYLINHKNGYHTEIPAFLINHHHIDTKDDAEAYVARLSKMDILFSQIIERLQSSEKKGIIPPQFVFPIVTKDCKAILTGKPFSSSEKDSPLLEDFRKKINLLSISQQSKTDLLAKAEEALLEHVKPAYTQLLNYWSALEKKATNEDGIWKIPGGDKKYIACLKTFTSTDLTPDQIYELGLKEVARIQEEMRVIMKKVNFKNNNLHDFFKFMRTDKQFYYSNTDKDKKAYVEKAMAIIDTMRRHLDQLFYTQPVAKLMVKPVEPFREESSSGAFYEIPAIDGSRPGIYYINLHDIADQPIYQMEALAYHEGIPGHHMQLAIAQELKNIPQFRRVRETDDAYVEGWALYSESLGKEIGFYQDPYSDFGRLAMEIFRASRLVVDVGIHWKKWTREQAVQYMLANTPLTEGDIRQEVSRYVVWPGQATAYMIGKLKILELREKVKYSLKDKFDIKAFHDVVLTNGAMPLNLLEEVVDQYINETNKK